MSDPRSVPSERPSGDDHVAFYVTNAGTFKRIHRRGCTHARHPYKWADQFGGSTLALLDELVASGAVMWHLGCKRCCSDIDHRIRELQALHVRNVIEEHLRDQDEAVVDGMAVTDWNQLTIPDFAALCREKCSNRAQGHEDGRLCGSHVVVDGEDRFAFCGRHWGYVL